VLTVLESRFERFRPEHGPHAAGGGTLPDFGSHLADQALVLAGPVTGVYAEVHHRADPGGLDDDVFVALTHELGSACLVRRAGWAAWGWSGVCRSPMNRTLAPQEEAKVPGVILTGGGLYRQMEVITIGA